MSEGQIHETDGQGAAKAVAQGLPFRGEKGEGVEGGVVRLFRRVDEQGDRRLQRLVEQEGQDGFSVRRAFHQQTIRLQIFQRAQETAGAARPVVADTEKVNGLIGHGEALCKR